MLLDALEWDKGTIQMKLECEPETKSSFERLISGGTVWFNCQQPGAGSIWAHHLSGGVIGGWGNHLRGVIFLVERGTNAAPSEARTNFECACEEASQRNKR